MAAIGGRVAMTAIAAAIAALALAAAADAKKKAPPKVKVASATASASGAFDVATATAACPGKTKAIGGGFATSAPQLPTHWLDVYESRRVGDDRWRVSGVEYFAGGDSLTAYVYCEALNPKAKIKTATATAPLGALNAATTAFATCPKRTKAFSGGFASPPATATDASYVSRATGTSGTGWVVDATNLEGAAPREVTAYAYCAVFGKLKGRSASVAVTGPAGKATAVLTPACPNGGKAHSGGFATSTPVGGLTATALVYESRALGKRWIGAAAASGAATSSTLVATGYCAG
jgi:hypothetical protein